MSIITFICEAACWFASLYHGNVVLSALSEIILPHDKLRFEKGITKTYTLHVHVTEKVKQEIPFHIFKNILWLVSSMR